MCVIESKLCLFRFETKVYWLMNQYFTDVSFCAARTDISYETCIFVAAIANFLLRVVNKTHSEWAVLKRGHFQACGENTNDLQLETSQV